MEREDDAGRRTCVDSEPCCVYHVAEDAFDVSCDRRGAIGGLHEGCQMASVRVDPRNRRWVFMKRRFLYDRCLRYELAYRDVYSPVAWRVPPMKAPPLRMVHVAAEEGCWTCWRGTDDAISRADEKIYVFYNRLGCLCNDLAAIRTAPSVGHGGTWGQAVIVRHDQRSLLYDDTGHPSC